MFALILKELRSISRFVALALLVDGWLLSELTGQSQWMRGASPGDFALVQPDWLSLCGFILAGIASLLGFVMSLDDGLRGTWAFA